MIREDQLDPDQREFINQVILSDKNFVFVDNTFQNFRLAVLLGWIIRKCKETNILLIFPNNLILSQYKSIYEATRNELSIKNKVVYFTLIDNAQNAELTIYFLLDQPNTVTRLGNRSIYFTHNDLGIPNTEVFKSLILYQHRPSLSRIAEKLKGFSCFISKSEMSRVDASIRNKVCENEKEEFNFIITENEMARSVGELSVVLFSNDLFLMRFINHLFDYAQFDLAEYDFDLNEYQKLNDLFDYYGLPYAVVAETIDYHKINQINIKTIICTFSTTKYLIDVKMRDVVFIPQTNRVSLGLKRSKELANFLISSTSNRMYTTSSEIFRHPNSIIKLFN